MKCKYLLILVVLIALSGCMHGRRVHSIPSERNYASMAVEKVSHVTPVVDKAHRVGAQHFAPYEYTSANTYLEWAKEERAESDRKGEWDYATLARKYADDAIAKGSGIEDKGILKVPDNLNDCQVEFERLKARYLELDSCKAKLVAPVLYAHIEAQLSIAEHELLEKHHHVQAIRYLRPIEADIDAIWAKDVDGDGVKDMQDGEPWIPEDLDGYEDTDGIPEPKPYPILDPILFLKGSDQLSNHAKGYLKGVGDMLIDGYSEVTVYLSGHSDGDALDDYNMYLSMRRVNNVANYLKEHGVKAEMLWESQHGERKPVVNNSTEAEKTKNRRVEILLHSPDVVSPYCN